MNFFDLLFLLLTAALLNVAVFYLFRIYMLQKPNPAMKFLFVNTFKDILWVGYWLFQLENTTANLLSVIGVFLFTSFFLYFKVIRLLNRS